MAEPGGVAEQPQREQVGARPEFEPVRTLPESGDAAARREVIEALEKAGGPRPSVPTPSRVPSVLPPAPVDPSRAYEPAVQRILSEGLYETYAQLPPALQAKFKVEGERTASAVAKLLTDTKVQLGKIMKLIRRWLSIIPGVNRYYLEQEAKLKADAVMALKKTPQR
jgi:hypothetical protein